LNSRVNFRRCICRLRLHETPNLGVHETGSRPDRGLRQNVFSVCINGVERGEGLVSDD